uniref:serine C-palmitoyltransferase n=1 Tax=Arcella intermedia TaxID=1963864 RepID=A0A6B2L2A3_9EUKA|eukprot:TRINITY_DN3946_c0_g1_i1.p1 TRINITY_DN3946_c0_g1~~TRINITY_DN3946_c0_g1_i1.p1  ORF type:complete len:505 (+),score=81.35 TRINITY_DN3946_c0_g1_i1:33-1517(+)
MAGSSREDPDLPWYHIIMVYFSYLVLLSASYIQEWFGKKSFTTQKGYAPLFRDWDSFWTRHCYRRISDCWNRPVDSIPGPRIDVKERETSDFGETWKDTETVRHCLNLGSYNYLGFSDSAGTCLESVQQALREYGVSTASTRADLGTTSLHRQAELKTAKFLNKEDCIIFGMGYATNAATIPCLANKGCLIISDSLNHASLVNGCRSSGAKIKVFEHNDVEELEKVVRNSIITGQPRTHRPWKKILIIVEGIYSMEGEIAKLREIVAIKKKYNCYLWVDEAHSIGAIGRTGRGVTEHCGVDTGDVDVLMGTYTKSFASVGGYITGPKELINHLRQSSFATLYSTSMSPGCCQQILTSMGIIMGEDGTDQGKQKIISLRENSNFFRRGLIDRGFQVYGDKDSPVIPLMLYYPSKIAAFSRECLKRNIACVVVGFPATPLLMSRARFCISAGHTKGDLEWALNEIDEVGKLLLLKYGNDKSQKDEDEKVKNVEDTQ